MNSIFKRWRGGAILLTDAGWGDSGKGKCVSALAPEIGAKIIGGHNAGHTVVTDKGELGLGLVPSTIIHPGTLNILGQEVVINPLFLLNEIEKLKEFGIRVSPKNFLIDPRAHLVMPWHEIRDALSEEARGKLAIGSLHLGVGWTYSDRINRRGLRLLDILGSDWKEKIKLEYKNQLGVIDDASRDVKRKTGKASRVKTDLTLRRVLEVAKEAKRLAAFAANTTEIIWRAVDKNAKILFEDSHGAMLDVAHGSWPFTTGVNTGLGGLYRSFGGKAVRSLRKIVVCSKAYQTRVGGGPMPTEDFGKFGEYVRQKGHEIGTRSGRARRCGAFDAPLVKYGLNALGLSADDEIALTKLDVLSGLAVIPVCVSYVYKKRDYKMTPSTSADFLQKVKPRIVKVKGWQEDISAVRRFRDLPKEAQDYASFIEKLLERKITFIGVGKHKDAKILPS